VAGGDGGRRRFVVVEGRAEAAGEGPAGPAPVTSCARGEYFGEIALLHEGGRREATVKALTELRTLSLSAAAFRQLLAEHPEAERAFHAAADKLLIVKFLKQASPFWALDPTKLT